MCPVPFYTALNQERDNSQNRSHDNHRVKTNQTAFEEIFHGQRLRPAVVIRIADNETGQDKEEIHCQITMIDTFDGSASGKSVAFEDVIPYD